MNTEPKRRNSAKAHLGFLTGNIVIDTRSYIEVAVRTKSFAAAAKELNVKPAAISH